MKKVLFLFGELNDDDIDWLIANGHRETIPEGTVLIQEGQTIDTLYILLEGQVTVSISTHEGEAQIADLASGEVFGEMSFVDSRPPSATVQAVEQSLVLSIPRSKLAIRLHQDVGFASRFYRAIALFLSSRLRGTVRFLGYGKPPHTEAPHDDLAPEIADNLPIANARFDWLLRRLVDSELVVPPELTQEHLNLK
ncbi:cyclic nucleotide-binding domain-containing protein [Desertifilum sp. FACHB-1129]|uniref:Cyclic nucleotide-binding protein n=1 Tax=Desertifilum tharense IPPAS B-1220 TaxID=1781255 RepID=A0A1E5QDT2_9CYAN|nr:MULTISPECIES: cyclic nucleotide-binding domain-containing protein [Cyanophyceae]MDA0209041.1 cyclic nucleotide-binding domain-containing protein [Cyanobacteria bacterium FC1]MDK3158055.1 cyclic nucleotide-binding domain-containing protein [Kamptonema cortianum]MBD2310523.1 cyclic nucleotide-binding domain-containing protein [Desertifilum sp. FACHB-1129]MBD2321975.1 cyclic nucleotide-binding domain-containing protein [Desertifilum sp. FACHB-866]MBD2332102.1 cyclic nucleotide-binding domain-c